MQAPSQALAEEMELAIQKAINVANELRRRSADDGETDAEMQGDVLLSALWTAKGEGTRFLNKIDTVSPTLPSPNPPYNPETA